MDEATNMREEDKSTLEKIKIMVNGMCMELQDIKDLSQNRSNIGPSFTILTTPLHRSTSTN